MEFSPYKHNFIPISKSLTNFEQELLNLEQVRYIENPSEFYKETAYQKEVDGKLSYYYLFSKIKSNNFNEGSGYLTHGFDFYRGSFHGQMIRGLINYCNLKKDSVILDPFCGSGTVLIESRLLGFNSIGIDINPIASLNSIIKTKLLETPIEALLLNNNKYFDLTYYEKIFTIKGSFNKILNENMKELFYIFLFSRALAMENRFSRDKEIYFRTNFQKTIKILREIESLKKTINLKMGDVKVIFNDSYMELKKMKTNSIDAIITSPPYVDLIDYIQEDLVPIKFFFDDKEINYLKKNSIGFRSNNEDQTNKRYWYKINLILNELLRVLKPNKNCIIIIGNYKQMLDIFKNIAKEKGFFIEMILRRNVVNIKKKENIEFVLFLKKKIIINYFREIGDYN